MILTVTIATLIGIIGLWLYLRMSQVDRKTSFIDIYSFDFPPDRGPLAQIALNVSRWAAEIAPVTVISRNGSLSLSSKNLCVIQLAPQSATPLSFTSKLRSYSHFLAKSFLWSGSKKLPALAILFTNPPFLDLIVGLLCVIRKTPFIVVAQELYPELLKTLHPLLLFASRPVVGKLRRFVYRRARAVVCISTDSQIHLAAQGILNTVVIENFFLRSLPTYFARRPKANRNVLCVRYAGNLGMACDVELFETVLEKLERRNRFLFQFVGEGFKESKVLDLVRRFPNVMFERLKELRVGERSMASDGDACLILSPSSSHAAVFSSKLSYAAALGIPVLAIGPRASSLHQIIQDEDVGFSAPSDDVEAVLKILDTAYSAFHSDPVRWNELGENGLRAHRKRWDGTLARARYKSIIGDALAGTRFKPAQLPTVTDYFDQESA